MKKRALCVGINDYPSTSRDLRGCVNDAKDWAAELSSRGFMVQQLINASAVRASFLQSIEHLVSASAAGDVAVITYSGHGTWVAGEDGDGDQYRSDALCPHDVALGALVAEEDLETLVSNCKPGVRLVVISDACHTGTFRRLAPALDPTLPETVRFLSPELPLRHDPLRLELARVNASRGSQRNSRALFLSACQQGEYSWDAWFEGRANGAFTRVALDTLRAASPRSYAQWLHAIREKLPSVDYPQTPELSGTSAQRMWDPLG